MEEEWVVKRCRLREVWLEHPEWSRKTMAEEVGCSKSWVKKWLRRIRSVLLEDQQVMYGLSRTPKHPPPCFSPQVIDKILEIRDHPPRLLGRTPGPLTILYYLHQDQALKESEEKLPRSTRTVWKILTQHQRIQHSPQSIAEPEERPALVSNGGWTSMMSAASQQTQQANSNMWLRSSRRTSGRCQSGGPRVFRSGRL